jgi:hypothetical protein
LPLALAGVMAARGASKDPALTLVVVWERRRAAGHAPFAVTSRTRMAIEAGLIVLGRAGAMRLFGLIKKRDMPPGAHGLHRRVRRHPGALPSAVQEPRRFIA